MSKMNGCLANYYKFKMALSSISHSFKKIHEIMDFFLNHRIHNSLLTLYK